MRITALSSVIVLALVGSAHADRNATLAVLTPPARPARAALTGELRLTGPTRAPRLAAFLDADAITAEVAPHATALERCYLDRVSDPRRAGHLDILLEIARDGRVRSVAAAATGLTPRSAPQVTACIRAITEAVQFPRRRNDTTAVLPYEFHRTDAPDAGPQPSCWRASGC